MNQGCGKRYKRMDCKGEGEDKGQKVKKKTNAWFYRLRAFP